jgi:hypothetical protein
MVNLLSKESRRERKTRRVTFTRHNVVSFERENRMNTSKQTPANQACEFCGCRGVPLATPATPSCLECDGNLDGRFTEFVRGQTILLDGRLVCGIYEGGLFICGICQSELSSDVFSRPTDHGGKIVCVNCTGKPAACDGCESDEAHYVAADDDWKCAECAYCEQCMESAEHYDESGNQWLCEQCAEEEGII